MTSNPQEEDDVNFNHFATFGGIIHGFARLEWVLQGTMAAVADLDVGKVTLLTRELGYSAKRDALYSYMEVMETPDDLKVAIKGFLDAANEYLGLRNHIAHSLWRKGSRPKSIRPMTIRVRAGKGKIIGGDEERDYTETELALIADKLRQIHNSYIQFMKNRGFDAFMATE
jgi:hypothetical protein